jgi:hypothetical protein
MLSFIKFIQIPVISTSFLVLANAGNLKKPTCPADMVAVNNNTCIDKYEWPNKKGELPLVGASGLPEPRDIKNKETWDADSFCKSVGKRVCWADEWVKACKGKNNSPYPWGSQVPKYIPGEFDSHLACNFGKQYIGPDEYKIYLRDKKEMARLDLREPSGERNQCKSEVGAFDMVGNVEEWVRCRSKTGWCLAGRYWSELYRCDQLIGSHAPKWHYYQSGFRCCKDLN